MRYLTRLSMIVVLAVGVAPAAAHDSPIDHVSRTIKLAATREKLFVRYRIQLTERTALLELKQMDADGNGQIGEDERRRFFENKSGQLADALTLEIGGKTTAVEPAADVTLDADFGQTYLFVVPLENLGAGTLRARLTDQYSRRYPGPYRWIPQDAVAAAGPVKIEPVTPATLPAGQRPETIQLEFDLTLSAESSK